jgi:3-hydroxybutyryl-CoA dehydrogenase
MSEIKKVGVLGCGLMGSGIAQTAAVAGFTTVVRDVADPFLQKGKTGIEKSLARLVEKGKLTAPDREKALTRLSFTTAVPALRDCDIVIEAVTEDLDLKNQLWKELDGICPPRTIFASNTSSLTIAAMASATRRADRFVGLHFFNPVPLMPLVEVIRTGTTSPETFDMALTFAAALGKEPVATVDRPGFIVNLLLVPFLLDSVRALERGVASTGHLDRAMQLGCGHPMGPLTLLDFIGLDTVVRIADIMHEAYHDDRYAAPSLLRRMVRDGLNGKKTGKGFYDYSGDAPTPSDLGLGKA